MIMISSKPYCYHVSPWFSCFGGRPVVDVTHDALPAEQISNHAKAKLSNDCPGRGGDFNGGVCFRCDFPTEVHNSEHVCDKTNGEDVVLPGSSALLSQFL